MMKLFQAFTFSFALFALVALASYSQAQTISMNFSLRSEIDPNNPSELAQLAPGDVAGVVAVNNWNDLPTTIGSAADLVNSAGAATTADITWTTGNTWGGDVLAAATTPDEVMMFAWLDDSPSLSVTLSDIPYPVYDAYIYGNTENFLDPFQNTGKALRWNVNGSEEASSGVFNNPGDASGTYFTGSHVDGRTGVDNPSYMKISGLVGDLSISGYGNSSAARSAIAGIQIVQAVDEGRFRLNIDRDTGQMDLVNNTGAAVDFAGITMRSSASTLNSANWKSITDNYDQGVGGSISPDAWLKFVNSATELTEATLGAGTLADSQTLDLGTAWDKFPVEDVTMEYLDSNGDTIVGAVVFSGTTATEPYAFGDYNFDGNFDTLDWQTQRDNFRADMSGMSLPGAYSMGDFDLDGDNDIHDLNAFKAAFKTANPFASLDGSVVPEPSAILLFAIAGALVGCRRASRTALRVVLLMVLTISLAVGGFAYADGPISINFSAFYDINGPNDLDFSLDPNEVAGIIPTNNWNDFLTNFDDPVIVGSASNLVDGDGISTTADINFSANNLWGGFWETVPADPDYRMMDVWLDDGGDGVNVSVSDIPWFQYDVYVLGTSDDTGKALRWDVNGNDVTTASVFVNPQNDFGDYFTGTHVDGSDPNGENPSYLKFSGLTGDLSISGFGNTSTTRSAISGIQIVENTGPVTVLSLEINSDTGVGKLKNTTSEPIDLDFYEIASDPTDSLTYSTWNSIQDNGQNGFPQGDGSGNGWEELGNLGNDLLAEFFLDGGSTLAAGASLSLGNIYNTATGVETDIDFLYNDPNSTTKTGKVDFVTGTGLAGDFDDNGVVNGYDFLLWQQDPGIGLLSDWEANYGMVAPLSAASAASAATSAVPEPTSLALLALGLTAIGAGGRRFRRRMNPMNASAPVIRLTIFAVACGWLLESSAIAASTNDREYWFGEDALELVTGMNHAGKIIGSDNNTGAGLLAGNTADSIGPTGAYLDLTQSGDPTYQKMTGGPTPRPGANSGDYGAEFDGVDDLLWGIPLNRPDELAGPTSVGDGPILPGYPHNYDKITARGLQLWVYPDATALADPNAQFQSIVADTIVSGGPAIDDAGNWTQINNWGTPDPNSDFGPLAGTVPVTGNTWYHVMHHNDPILGNEHKSVVYVDGVAVSANIAEITAGVAGCDAGTEICDLQLEGYVGQLVVGATEVRNDGLTPAYGFHFTGRLDNLEMYVFGDNTAFGGMDYGTFDLFEDNEWIATEIVNTITGGVLTPGDVNKDGSVNGDGTGDPSLDDVSAFVVGWEMEHTVDGVTVGDWNTWDNGDLDHNGVTDFADWFLLLSNHPAALSLDLSELLAAVPEPTSMTLAGLALTGLCLGRGRHRPRQ